MITFNLITENYKKDNKENKPTDKGYLYEVYLKGIRDIDLLKATSITIADSVNPQHHNNIINQNSQMSRENIKG